MFLLKAFKTVDSGVGTISHAVWFGIWKGGCNMDVSVNTRMTQILFY
jgi:hypothetical protein